jgi:hypothetical protein
MTWPAPLYKITPVPTSILHGCAFEGPTQPLIRAPLWSWSTNRSYDPKKVIKIIPLGHFRLTRVRHTTWQPMISPSWTKLSLHNSLDKFTWHQSHRSPLTVRYTTLPSWNWAGFDSLCGSHGYTVNSDVLVHVWSARGLYCSSKLFSTCKQRCVPPWTWPLTRTHARCMCNLSPLISPGTATSPTIPTNCQLTGIANHQSRKAGISKGNLVITR